MENGLLRMELPTGGTKVFQSETLRNSELSEVTGALSNGLGILLVGPYGSGKSVLTHRALSTTEPDLQATRLRGSPYATDTPYGALALLLASLEPEGRQDFGRVVHQMRTSLKKPLAGGSSTIVIDHAELLDHESARVLEHLVINGEVRLYLQCRSTDALDDDLLNLWADGYLHRVDLGPLQSRASGDLLEALLEGPVSPTLLEHAWTMAEGNPKYLRVLAADWSLNGKIMNRSGIWVLAAKPDEIGPRTMDAINDQLSDLPQLASTLLRKLTLSAPQTLSGPDTSMTTDAIDVLVSSGLVHMGTVKGQRTKVSPTSALLVDALAQEKKTPASGPAEGGRRKALLHAEEPSADALAYESGRVEGLLDRYHYEEASQIARVALEQQPRGTPSMASEVRLRVIEGLARVRLHQIKVAECILARLPDSVEALKSDVRPLEAVRLALAQAEISSTQGRYSEAKRYLDTILVRSWALDFNSRAEYLSQRCEVLAAMGTIGDAAGTEQELLRVLETRPLSRNARLVANRAISRLEAMRETRLMTVLPPPDVHGEKVENWPSGLEGPLLSGLRHAISGLYDDALKLVTPSLRQGEVWDASRTTSIGASIAVYAHAALGQFQEADYWRGWTGETDENWFYGRMARRLCDMAAETEERSVRRATLPTIFGKAKKSGSPSSWTTDRDDHTASIVVLPTSARRTSLRAEEPSAGRRHPRSTEVVSAPQPLNFPPVEKTGQTCRHREGSPNRWEPTQIYRGVPWLKLLTPRERQMVTELVGGLSNREIAAGTGLSIRTVEGYLYQAYSKLQVRGRIDLIALLKGGTP